MKDLIAKLQMDATCAMGAIWMHIDAQAARIAELEAQIAASADSDKLREAIAALDELADEAEANGNTSAWTNSIVAKVRACLCDEQSAAQISMLEQQLEETESLIAQISHGAAERISSLEAQTKSVDADKVREALKLAVRQNSCDMLMTGEEIRKCEAALNSTALQAPVREVPGWKLVPLKLTQEMSRAGVKLRMSHNTSIDGVYAAMLAAAPLPADPVQEPKP